MAASSRDSSASSDAMSPVFFSVCLPTCEKVSRKPSNETPAPSAVWERADIASSSAMTFS